MGVSQSIPLPRYGCCIRPQNPNRCKENHSRMPKSKGHRRNLSAAFSFPEAESCVGNDMLNINTATEEEFMTLPGINRQTAQNIVEYRRHIDGFRKVEDLALVSGVGATRLNHIRHELCVGKRGLSKNSSASSSGIDLSMHDNVSRGSATGQPRKVNINASNVFQLMKVRFISQTLAENIVAYRDRKGPFASFDDLLKVKGIKVEVLSAIQPYLSLEDSLSVSTVGGVDMTGVGGSKFAELSDVESQGIVLPVGPLSQMSIRSSTISSVSHNCVRVASWNLDNCSLEKMENPGVREVIAMTILENGFGIVVIQDITSPEALQKLVDELTCSVLTNIKNWNGPRGKWKYIVSSSFASTNQTSSHLAFLYDTEKEVELKNSGFAWTVSSSDDGRSVPLFLAEFQVRSLELTIANVYMEPPKCNDRLSEAMIEPVASLLTQYEKQGTKNLMLAGHFGMSPDCTAMASSLGSSNFCPILSARDFTDISPENLSGSRCTENVFLSEEVTKAHTGKMEVIRSGLINPWIPNGKWGWGGTASSHCPLLVEFYIDGSLDAPKSSQGSVDSEGNCITFSVAGDS